MSWGQLTPDRLVTTLAVEEAFDVGALVRHPASLFLPLPPLRKCWTRTNFETFVYHKDMSESGIQPNRMMTRAQMEAYRRIPSTTPLDLTATHTESVCPDLVVNVTWDDDGRAETKRIDWSPDDGATWYTLDPLIPENVSWFTHSSGPNTPVVGLNRYRVRFESETDWAETSVVAQCPE